MVVALLFTGAIIKGCASSGTPSAPTAGSFLSVEDTQFLESLTQAEAADQMGISRSTFQRIISHARRQVTLALVNGSALFISTEIV
jgi:hypothetical protein